MIELQVSKDGVPFGTVQAENEWAGTALMLTLQVGGFEVELVERPAAPVLQLVSLTPCQEES